MPDDRYGRNPSGLPDPTRTRAEESLGRDEKRVSDLVHVLRYVADGAGFEILGREMGRLRAAEPELYRSPGVDLEAPQHGPEPAAESRNAHGRADGNGGLTMYHHTEKSGFPRKMEAPAEISILETNREVFNEIVRANTAESRQKMAEDVQNRLYEKIRLAFGIDMAAESPVDIYPVFTPEPCDPGAIRMDLVVAPRRMEDVRLEVKAEEDQGQADETGRQTMEWHCKECAHEKVCEEWGEQEGMAACSYQNYFEPKQKAPMEKQDGTVAQTNKPALPSANTGKRSECDERF